MPVAKKVRPLYPPIGQVDSMRALFGFVIGFVLWDVKDAGLPGARARRRGGRLQDRSFEFGLAVVVNGVETALQAEGAGP